MLKLLLRHLLPLWWAGDVPFLRLGFLLYPMRRDYLPQVVDDHQAQVLKLLEIQFSIGMYKLSFR